LEVIDDIVKECWKMIRQFSRHKSLGAGYFRVAPYCSEPGFGYRCPMNSQMSDKLRYGGGVHREGAES
jgi:hypothetical protein